MSDLDHGADADAAAAEPAARTPWPLAPRNLAAELVDRGDGWHVSPELLPEGHPQRREG